MATDSQEYDPFLEVERVQAERDKLEVERDAYVAEMDAKIGSLNDHLKQLYFDLIETRTEPTQDLRKILGGKSRWTEAAEAILVEAKKPIAARVLLERMHKKGYPHVTSNMVSTWLTRMKDKGVVRHGIFTNKITGKKTGKWGWIGAAKDGTLNGKDEESE